MRNAILRNYLKFIPFLVGSLRNHHENAQKKWEYFTYESRYSLRHFLCLSLSKLFSNWMRNTVLNSKEKSKDKPFVVHSLQTKQNLVISRCRFAEKSKKKKNHPCRFGRRHNYFKIMMTYWQLNSTPKCMDAGFALFLRHTQKRKLMERQRLEARWGGLGHATRNAIINGFKMLFSGQQFHTLKNVNFHNLCSLHVG